MTLRWLKWIVPHTETGRQENWHMTPAQKKFLTQRIVSHYPFRMEPRAEGPEPCEGEKC